MNKARSEDRNALSGNEIDSVPHVLDTIVGDVGPEDCHVRRGDDVTGEKFAIGEGL